MGHAEKKHIRLQAAAGGAGGSWFLLMQGLAKLVAEVHPEINIEVVEGGGVSIHARVGSGELPVGILNPPMTAAAIAGREPYDRAYPDLRIGVAILTVNYLQQFDPETAHLHNRGPLHPGVAR